MGLKAMIRLHHLASIEAAWTKWQAASAFWMKTLYHLSIGLPGAVEGEMIDSLYFNTFRENRDISSISSAESRRGMIRHGFGTAVHRLIITRQLYFKTQYGWQPAFWPKAMEMRRVRLCLPISPKPTRTSLRRATDASAPLANRFA